MPDVIVIGAGISGLTAAHRLAQAGKDVFLLEESSKAGGKIVTERVNGYLLESGPNSLRVENQETIDLIQAAGLRDRILDANPSSRKRYVLKHGKWVQLPRGPKEAISTPLLSLFGKLRILGDLFVPKTDKEDESAASFIQRRLGRELFDYAADPFITGIYSGDPEKLSMRHAFGSMWKAEQQHGSLIRGMMKARKVRTPGKVKPRVVSFQDGLSELTIALRSQLGDKLKLHSGAISIARTNNGYAVTTSSDTFSAPSIIFSLPAYHTAPIIEPFSPELASKLREVYYPPVAVIFLGYSVNQFDKVPEGFGGLIPSKEKRNILGMIFSSSNFPNRSPEGQLLFTILMGGAKHPEIAEWEERLILETAIAEASDLLKPKGQPAFEHLTVWRHAIPQYNIGYGAVLRAIDRAEAENPGMYFLGNYRGGISMGACIKNATELAKKLV